MPEYYTEETVVTDKFLFIGYSHEEKAQVRNSVNWLIGEDVQINLFARGSKHKHNIRYSEKYNSSLENHRAWQNNV